MHFLIGQSLFMHAFKGKSGEIYPPLKILPKTSIGRQQSWVPKALKTLIFDLPHTLLKTSAITPYPTARYNQTKPRFFADFS
jgi:hypothetical protein